jgi:hypothetical protein
MESNNLDIVNLQTNAANDATQLYESSHTNSKSMSKKSIEQYYEKNFRLVLPAEFKSGLFFKNVTIFLEPNLIKAFNPGDTNEYYPLVNLDFDMVSANLTIQKEQHQFRIQVLGSNYNFVFRTKKHIFNTIIMYVHQFIKSSRGNLLNLCGISLRKDFFKVNISPNYIVLLYRRAFI